jgi:RHS repeat-associated protein
VFNYLNNTNDQRLEEIKHLVGTNVLSKFNYTYDSDGQIQTWTQQADSGAPKTWVMDYDPVDQLLGATVRSNGITGAVLKRFMYRYDSAGNRTSEQIDLGVTKANYNHLNQQTNTVGGGPVRFAGWLDEKGTMQLDGQSATMGVQNTNFTAYADTAFGTNTITLKATDYSNNTRTNQYQLVVTNNGVAKTLSYDLNGNLTSAVTAASTNTYEWDAVNRLTKITQRWPQNAAQLVSEFIYDGLGRRVQITEKTNGVVQSDKRFQWCVTELCEERDSTGAGVTKRFFGGGEQISGANYFFTRDHLGSIREMSDGAGSLRARYDFDPYGRRTKVSGNLESEFAFTSHHYHPASGLHLTLFRGYDSDTGRWLNRDPIGEDGGLNLYEFVGGDPLNWIDTAGLSKVKVNGEVWHTPIQGDRDHVHVYNGVNQGRHMHGPGGKKFFPQTGMILNANGTWERVSNSFIKSMTKAVRAQLGKGLGALGLLSLLSLMQSDAQATEDQPKKIKQLILDVQHYLLTKDDTYAWWAAAGMHDLFGNEFAAHVFFRELTKGEEK